jgi:hypothetical protein
VLGLVSIFTFPVFVPAVAAIILAIIAAVRLGRANGAVKGKGFAIAGVCLGGLSVVGGIALWVALASSGLFNGHLTSYADLQAGDCINLPSGIVQVFHTLPCDQAHDREVVGVVVDPSPSGAPFPGTTALKAEAGQCSGQLANYIGAFPINVTRPTLTYLYPQQLRWNTGERHIVCLVGHSDGSKLTAAIRSSGTA